MVVGRATPEDSRAIATIHVLSSGCTRRRRAGPDEPDPYAKRCTSRFSGGAS